jgi:tape measure domain-containing protein
MALTAGSIEIKLFADIARLQSDMNKANKTVDTAMRNIDKSVALARRAFGGLIGGTLIGQVVKLADEYKKFDSQLRLSTKSLNDYSTAYDNVIRISRVAQSDIGAIGVLYARLNNNLREFNVTQQQIADVTENVSLALLVNNATVQETSSVMLQLSQSFGSGRLNGQEFLAVAEGAPALLRQLAKSMNVPFGALKDLSAQGKITKEELLKAFTDPAYLAANREMVKSVGTISSSITVLMNNLKLFVGEQDKATGASKVITSSIITLADNINLLANVAIAGAIVATGRYIGAKYALIASYMAENAATKAKQAGDVVAARAQVVLMEAQIAANLATNAGTLALTNNAMAATVNAKQTAALAAAKTGLATATTAANAGLTTARGLLAALGGPIGAIITALGLAAVAFQTFGKSGTDALDALYEKARLANKELEKTPEALLKAVPTLLEQNAQRRTKLIEKEIELQKTLDNLIAKGADKNIPGYVAAIQGQLKKVQDELNLSLQVYNDLQLQRLSSEEKIAESVDKAAQAEKFLRDQKIKFLNEELEEQRRNDEEDNL